MSRAGRWKSDSQANAEALARRSMPYSEASGRSFTVRWDWHNREPKDLREAVRMVRQAYADEVPTKLHNQDLADDGTPKMTPQAEGYIFGSDIAGTEQRPKCICTWDLATHEHRDDCPKYWQNANDPANKAVLDYYRTPFRAALLNLERQHPKRAAVVSHVAIGSMGPIDAAIKEGIAAWGARIVAEDCLRSFLRNLTDIKVHFPREEAA